MINQAIIPLAGLGTRLLPLTKSFPKKNVALRQVSILEKNFIRCLSAGIKEIFLIISDRKKLLKIILKVIKNLKKKY